ncbi:hypothetical protein SVAN01_08874 [Stagonosporopsis vannaccii]|nr:hypothetical protein SVAN01_08874 [Stagonosporopsis vannaccii]
MPNKDSKSVTDTANKYVVARLTLLGRGVALRAFGSILPDESRSCFLFSFGSIAVKWPVGACTAVEEVAIPSVAAEAAKGVGAAFANLGPRGEEGGVFGHFILLYFRYVPDGGYVVFRHSAYFL